MGVLLAGVVVLVGCVSNLTVTSGGATSAGHCNHTEKSCGSLYGIDWCGKRNGVESKEPSLPFARVSVVVRPQDFFWGFITLGLIIPMNVEYDMETAALPKKDAN